MVSKMHPGVRSRLVGGGERPSSNDFLDQKQSFALCGLKDPESPSWTAVQKDPHVRSQEPGNHATELPPSHKGVTLTKTDLEQSAAQKNNN